jgi:hypothetical protein
VDDRWEKVLRGQVRGAPFCVRGACGVRAGCVRGEAARAPLGRERSDLIRREETWALPAQPVSDAKMLPFVDDPGVGGLMGWRACDPVFPGSRP